MKVINYEKVLPQFLILLEQDSVADNLAAILNVTKLGISFMSALLVFLVLAIIYGCP
jgi:hypothetical protein